MQPSQLFRPLPSSLRLEKPAALRSFIEARSILQTVNIHGRIGRAFSGFDVNLDFDGDALEGRIGGTVIGNDVNLQLRSGLVSGRIGGQIVGFDITGSLSPTTLRLCFGGETLSDDLNLAIAGGLVTGRFSGSVLGKDVRLQTVEGGVAGRIGGDFEGKDVELNGSAALEVMALASARGHGARGGGGVQSTRLTRASPEPRTANLGLPVQSQGLPFHICAVN